MNISEIAKKIREAVMNRAETDGRVFHADAIEDEVTRILRAEYPPTNVWGYGTNLATGPDQPNTGESLFDVVNRMRVKYGYRPMTSQDPPDTNVTALDIKRLREAARQIAANCPDHGVDEYKVPLHTDWRRYATYLPVFPATCTVNGRTVTGPEAERIMFGTKKGFAEKFAEEAATFVQRPEDDLQACVVKWPAVVAALAKSSKPDDPEPTEWR